MSNDDAAQPEPMVCTAIDNDWGDDQPNLLMHPPCACPRCAPSEIAPAESRAWLQVFGQSQRMRVQDTELGELGRALLG